MSYSDPPSLQLTLNIHAPGGVLNLSMCHADFAILIFSLNRQMRFFDPLLYHFQQKHPSLPKVSTFYVKFGKKKEKKKRTPIKNWTHDIGLWQFIHQPTNQSKNAVCAFIKHSRYPHPTYKFFSIHSHAEKLYTHTFDIVDTSFTYEKEFIVCSFLQEFSEGKRSSL